MHAESPVIEIQHLSRRFAATDALMDVTLTVPRGVVFGLVGANGAGKTTLIKHMMGLLKPQSGSVSVFGLNPVSNPTGVLARVGYLSEQNELPEWMRVAELIQFTRAFYASWDESYAASLQRMFELDPAKQVAQLSKGQRARLGLLLALAHRADLLILDEPSSGLDPLVRRDILRAIIKTISDEGRTVVFSSHLLDEVERVADHVAIIQGGRILQQDALESLKSRFHRLVLQLDSPAKTPPRADGFFGWQGHERTWSALYQGDVDEIPAQLDAHVIEHTTPSLNEIFVALAEHRP